MLKLALIILGVMVTIRLGKAYLEYRREEQEKSRKTIEGLRKLDERRKAILREQMKENDKWLTEEEKNKRRGYRPW